MGNLVHRPQRFVPPRVDAEAIVLPAPPVLDTPAPFQWAQVIVPVLSSASFLLYGVISNNTALLIMGLVVVGISFLTPFLYRWSSNFMARAKYANRKTKYAAYIDDFDLKVQALKKLVLNRAAQLFPDMGEFAAWVDSSRLWERRLSDADFASVFVGVGKVRSGLDATLARPPESMEVDIDSALYRRAESSVDAARWIDSGPVALDMREIGVLSVEGERRRSLDAARSILLQLAMTCGPDELQVVAAYPPVQQADWEWIGLLPHVRVDQAGSIRTRVATTPGLLDTHLSELLAPRIRLTEETRWRSHLASMPHLVLIVDTYEPGSELDLAPLLSIALERAAELRLSVIALCHSADMRPSSAGAAVKVRGNGTAEVVLFHTSTTIQVLELTAVSTRQAAALAERLAPKRLLAEELRRTTGYSTRLIDLLDLDLSLPPAAAIRHHGPDRLRIPIGVSDDSKPLLLDLKESAEDGDGPHGLIVGATGSGKSQLLRSIVCSLAASHSVNDLSMLFIDFKGGATFDLLDNLPHSVGLISNLIDDLALLDRIRKALFGELERRQIDLRKAGREVDKIADYRIARESNLSLPPMPDLLIIVDEFGELLDARPDFLDVFLSIARTGRSLGIHLMLATQRLEAGHLRGLDTYFSYRICLRTFTPEESIASIGTRDAADLPPLPGRGYYRSAARYTGFSAARVSGPFDTGTPASAGRPASRPRSDVAAIVDWLSDQERVDPLWRPPLPDASQGKILPISDPRLHVAEAGTLAVGLIDDPAHRNQIPLQLNFFNRAGHLMFVGGPGSGKTSLMRSILVQGTRARPATELRFLIIETARELSNLQHRLQNIALAATLSSPRRVKRIISYLENKLDSRMIRMTESDTDAPSAHQPTLVLLIDGLLTFRERYPDLDEPLGRLIADGAHNGILVVLASGRWNDVPPKRLERIVNRLELRLADPQDSQISRIQAATIRPDRPGRGLLPGGMELQVAYSGDSTDEANFIAASEAHQSRWPGDVAPAVNLLSELSLELWTTAVQPSDNSPILGVAEQDFRPICFPLETACNLVVVGDRGTGRSATVGRMVGQLVGASVEAKVVDYRGDLRKHGSLVNSSGLEIASDPVSAEVMLNKLAEDLAGRLKSRTSSVKLRPLFLVIDDWDVVGMNPMPPGISATLLGNLSTYVEHGDIVGFSTIIIGAPEAMSGSIISKAIRARPWYLEFSVEQRATLPSQSRNRLLPPGQAYLVRPSTPEQLLQTLPPL